MLCTELQRTLHLVWFSQFYPLINNGHSVDRQTGLRSQNSDPLLNIVNKIVRKKSSKLFWISPSTSAEEAQDDGSWSPWSSWSSCSTTCGEGAQRRSRDCADPPPSQGGTECPGSDEEMRSCETGTCPVTSSSNATSTDCKTVRYWDVLRSISNVC